MSWRLVFLCAAAIVGTSPSHAGLAVGADVQVPDELQAGAALRIGSFNIQIFGNKKMESSLVRDVLVKVLLRYDIVLIMEIRSVTDEAINELLDLVNTASSPPGVYAMVLSERLGRSHSKEQYAFLYRTDRASAVNSYVYNDKEDVFEREPFVVHFTSPITYVKDFVFVGIHTSPSDAEKEIDHLVDVYDDIITRLGVRDVMIMGDFNAGCSYVTKPEWKEMRLASDKRFYWLFTNEMDTTVARSDCPYDRMVIAGEQMVRGVLPNTAKAFRFDKAYKLTQDESERVSDHWPIEIQLKDAEYENEEEFIAEPISLTIQDARIHDLSRTAIYALRGSKNPLLALGFQVTGLYKRSGGLAAVTLARNVASTAEAITAVRSIAEQFPKLLSTTQVAVVRRKTADLVAFEDPSCRVKKSRFGYQVLLGPCSAQKPRAIRRVELECSLVSFTCELRITAQ